MVGKLDFSFSFHLKRRCVHLNLHVASLKEGIIKKDHLERSKDDHEGLASPGAKSQLKKP